MTSAWQCIKIGSAACAKIVPVAPWIVAAYLAVHPLPTDCAADCHFVIPRGEFLPGGMFAPEAPGPMTAAKPEAAKPDGPMLPFGGEWAPGTFPTAMFFPPAPSVGSSPGGSSPGGSSDTGGSTGGSTGSGPGSGPGAPFGGIPTLIPPSPGIGGGSGGSTGTDGGTSTTAGGGQKSSQVPEPATGLLLLASLGGLLAARRRSLYQSAKSLTDRSKQWGSDPHPATGQAPGPYLYEK